jgi:hypothetical protein
MSKNINYSYNTDSHNFAYWFVCRKYDTTKGGDNTAVCKLMLCLFWPLLLLQVHGVRRMYSRCPAVREKEEGFLGLKKRGGGE